MGVENKILAEGARIGAKFIVKKWLRASIPGVGIVLSAYDLYCLQNDIKKHNKEKVDPIKANADLLSTAIGQIGDRTSILYGGAIGELTEYWRPIYPMTRDFIIGYNSCVSTLSDRPREYHSPRPGRAIDLIDIAMENLRKADIEKGQYFVQQLESAKGNIQANRTDQFPDEVEDLCTIVKDLKQERSKLLYDASKNRSPYEGRRDAMVGITGWAAVVTGVVLKKLVK